MAGLTAVVNLLSKFKIVRVTLVGEGSGGSLLVEIMSTRIIGQCRESIMWVSDALGIRTNQVMAKLVTVASGSPLV